MNSLLTLPMARPANDKSVPVGAAETNSFVGVMVMVPPKQYSTTHTHPAKKQVSGSGKGGQHNQLPEGSWLHAGYHLTSGTTGPQILSLPFAIAALGWGPGLFTLCLGGLVSFYAYRLQISVIDRATELSGQRPQHFRDLSVQALGERWSNYLVVPLQFVVCFATVVSCVVLGGQTLKAIFQGQELSLYQFTIVFGCLHMLMSQVPNMHSLRHLNLLSLLASISYCILIVYGAISAGLSHDFPKHDHSIDGKLGQKLFGFFNALSILSNVYGNVIIVEIQSAIRPSAARNMVKGLCLCYGIIIITILPVAIAGYWAFGSLANGNILKNIFPAEGKQYLPSWMCILLNVLIFIQLVVSSLMYSHPTFAMLEETPTIRADASKPVSMWQGWLLKLASRCMVTVFATLLAAMLPYFGSINALIGALGYTPLVFVVPMIFHLAVFQPRPRSLQRRLNYAMIAVFSIVSILGCVSSVQQLVVDAKKYHLFANI